MLRRTMKILLSIVVCYLSVMLLSGLAIKALLSEARIQTLVSSAETVLPVKISARGGDFELNQWLLIRPSVSFKDVVVFNPNGFGESQMISAKGASVRANLLSLFRGRIEVLQMELRYPEIMISRNLSGVTNFEHVAAALAKADGPSKPQVAAFALNRVSIEGGLIRCCSEDSKKNFVLRDLDILLSDCSAGKTCLISADARLLDSQNSRLEFSGEAGPFAEGSLPVKGNLVARLAPAEIDAGIRGEVFGGLLVNPPQRSRITIESVMRGDLTGTVEGDGIISLSDLAIGRNKEGDLPFAGKVPLHLTLKNVFQSPFFQINTSESNLRLGQGKWMGSAQVRYTAGRLETVSRGAVSDVRIQEMLAAFTSSPDVIHGLAEVPEYSLRSEGRDSREIMQSLSGNGQIRLKEGQLLIIDLLEEIYKYAGRLLDRKPPSSEGTDFSRLSGGFDIRNEVIVFYDLRMESPVSVVTGSGRVGFDHSLDFDVAVEIRGDLAARLGGKPDSGGVARVIVPARVGGSLESPKVYPNLGAIVKQAVTAKAKDLLESIFEEKAEEQKK